ncbi:hypothetical protein [uncultured Aquimarina sp.]|uniref:hypothetical protein n=1 Tax=uncultured Aquimarina sp. TaxID=575652 RepID=UPI00260422F6|nr:hypothetical protein [uncultured Aquimarina sp.]
MRKIIYLIFIITLTIGCGKEKLPNDIEFAKRSLNSNMQRILNKEENSTYRNSKKILHDLKQQRKQTLEYKALLESRGFANRYNDEVLVFLDEKIEEYSNNSVASNGESVKNTCNICGRRFVGRGYEEKQTGLWVLTQSPYQSFICSKGCGAVHTEKQVKRYGF